MTLRFPDLPFRDRVWRINFEDGREPAYLSEYNDEIIAWTDNIPTELKSYGGHLYSRMGKLSQQGMIFIDEGPNEE